MSPEPRRGLAPLTDISAVSSELTAEPSIPSSVEPEAPVARVVPRVEELHGDVRVDEYHWLRDRDDPETMAYLQAENDYTESVMRPTDPLQHRLYEELVGRIEESDLSVPERRDQAFYYIRTQAGRQYPILCRRVGDVEADEEILLDQNELAAGQSYFRLGTYELSPDQRTLAYAVDTSGAEDYTLFFKDLETGALLAESIPGTAPGVAWANDNRTVYYTVLDGSKRPFKVLRHRLGTDPAGDAVVHEETDHHYFASVSRTRSGRFLLLDLSSHSTSEVRFASADEAGTEFRVIEPRQRGVEYGATHRGDRFWIVTNADAPNFRLVTAPVEAPSRANWTDVLPHRPSVKVDGADAFRDHVVVYQRWDGLRGISVLELDEAGAVCGSHEVAFPETVYSFRPHANPEFESPVLRFTYTSMVTPSSVVDYDMAARSWTVRKQVPVRGGYDPSRYRTERLFATAPDGTRIPLSLVWREPIERDGRRPLLLLGYGAYGLSYDPVFSPNHLSLLDRGFVVAIAHVRGGEELGRPWYDAGRLDRKRNTFTDFIAAAEHLVAEGFTAPDRLVISGGSAGGLLMGAVTNLRPDLFRIVLADVPFVDVVNTMLDPTLPLTVIEYDEWGDPNQRDAYHYIRSYSPYDNVERKPYPSMLVTGGLNDPRVAYWEPAKWVARLRARKTDGNRLLLKTNMGAGHGGASGRYDSLREVAFRYAFVLSELGME